MLRREHFSLLPPICLNFCKLLAEKVLNLLYAMRNLLLLLILWSISITAQVDPKIAYKRSLEKVGDLIQLGLPISALALTLIEKDWEGSK